MHRIFVLSFHGIDRALESCHFLQSLLLEINVTIKSSKNGFTGKRYRVSRSIVHSKETKVKICEDEPLNKIADTSRKWK